MDKFEFKGIPTFKIKDYLKAKQFYVDFLGFKIDWEHRFGPTDPIYMQVSNNGLVLHLTENERFQSRVIIFVETTGIENFHKILLSNKNNNLIPSISLTNWNTKQLEIEDPFGNLLRFNEPATDQ